jgi:enamine deaminase RidA (YjgF/YER057c/UK114 family)
MNVQRVPSQSPYAPSIGFSAAVRAGDLIFVAGMTAVGADGEVVGGDDPYAQTREALRKVVEAVVQAGGRGAADVVQTRMSLVDPADWEAVGRAHGEVFGEHPPAAAMLVSGLLNPRMRIEVEAIARVSDSRAGRA